MASKGNRVILLLSRSLALCKLGELAELLPEAFRGLGLELLLLGVGVVDPAAAPPTAAFKVLSNICNNFKASGPNLDGSVPIAKGLKSEDIFVLLDGGVTAPGEEGVAVDFGGIPNRPGCNMANRLCC